MDGDTTADAKSELHQYWRLWGLEDAKSDYGLGVAPAHIGQIMSPSIWDHNFSYGPKWTATHPVKSLPLRSHIVNEKYKYNKTH